MTLLFFIITIILIGLIVITIVNTLTFPRLQNATAITTTAPKISILVPARNEAKVIEQTVHPSIKSNLP